MDSIFFQQVIGAGLVLCSLLYLLLTRVKVPLGVPPGSFGWPILGETVEFVRRRHKGGSGSFFNEKRKKYGNIYRTHLFFSPTVVVTGVDAQKLLQTDGNGSLTFARLGALIDLFGAKSLFFVDTDQHKQIRKAITGAMNWKVLKSQIPRLDELSIETLKSWEGAEVLASEELAKFTFYSILGLLLSLKPSQYTETYLRHNFQIFAKDGASLPLKIPGTAYNRALQARKRLVDEIRNILEGRRKDGNAYEDVLYHMMQPGVDSQLSDEEIIDNILLLIFAGYDTTSTALAKVIQLLADHPHELNLVKAEQKRIQQELGDGGCLTWEKTKSMRYTPMVINEALRLSHLGIESAIRTARQDVMFHGYKIPRGWNIMIDKVSTDVNPEIYYEPLQFKPARFQEKLPNHAFRPFGGGVRICAGMEFANLEMQIFIHHLVNNYSWRLTGQDNDELSFRGIVQKPKNGLPILVQRLSQEDYDKGPWNII